MRYEATVHRLFAAGDERFVYAASSASILALDEESEAVLTRFASGEDLDTWLEEEGSTSSLETFEELVSTGLLKPSGEVPPAAPELPPMPYPLATLVLNVTNKCNLACTYCYEFGEDRLTTAADTAGRASRMSPETARQSIDLLFEEARGQAGVTITFFGGETLLNFDTIREAVQHAEQRAQETGKRVDFALTTNATLLDDTVIDFLVAHRFGVNISIDGAAGDQDRHRVFHSGRGSYEQIAPRIKKLLADNRASNGRSIGARVTLTSGAAPVPETFRHLTEELGFDHVGFAPVTSAKDRDYALGGDGMGKVLSEFTALADDYVAAALAGRRHGFSNLDDLLRELHQGANKAHPCGAGLGLVGVSTEGELGLCHRFVESGEHAIGDIQSGIDQERREKFLADGHISTKVACHDCFARPHCSGGCYHEAYVRYGDASQPNLHYCEWIRAWTELGLACYGRIAAGNPAFLARFDGVPAPETSDAIPPAPQSPLAPGN